MGVSDALVVAVGMANGLRDEAGMVGFGVATVCDRDGRVVQEVPFANIVTTQGDKYYAQMGAALVGTPNAAQPTKVNGMKLGTSQTAASKSGAGSYIGTGTYLSGSNNAFESAFPATAAVAGTDTGWTIAYEAYWGDGDVTSATIWEVAIVTSQASNAGESDATTTISRAKFPSVIDKSGSGYTLRVTWYHKFLGSA